MTAHDVKVFRHVFLQPLNLIILAAAAGLSLALSSPVPGLVALGAEGIWLMVAPSIPGFRRWLAAREPRPAEPAVPRPEATAALSPTLGRRLQALEVVAADIFELAVEQGPGPAALAQVRARLQGLLTGFGRMARLQQRLRRFLDTGPGPGLAAELMRLEEALDAERELTVRLSLRQALNIGQRRLKQHEQLSVTRRALDVKMVTLEMAFSYLRSALANGGTQAQLMGQLDAFESGTGFVADLEREAAAACAAATDAVVPVVASPLPAPAPAPGAAAGAAS
jgi:hypothetical protein